MGKSLAIVLFIFSALSGCNEESNNGANAPSTAPTEATPTEPSKKAATTATVDASAGTPTKVDAQPSQPTDADDDLCADPCRLLTEHKLKKLDGPFYCQTCGAVDTRCKKSRSFTPFALKDQCGQQARFRNCIYAANGYPFKKRQWQTVFHKASWYKPRANFKESELTAVEKSNISELRQRESQCRAKGLGPLSNKDTALVRAFFRKVAKGKPVLPEKLYTEFEESSPKQIARYLASFTFNKKSRTSYSSFWPLSKFDSSKYRVIEVHEGDRGPDCDDQTEPCEGDEYLIFLVDKQGKIRELALNGYSACPHVYVDSRLVGEILRNISSANREGVQHLRVLPAGDCRASLTLQIREEKAEKTFLDQVGLVIGDTVISPTTCDSETEGALCKGDGRYRILREGDETTLTFRIPPTHRCQSAELRAKGYYQPL